MPSYGVVRTLHACKQCDAKHILKGRRRVGPFLVDGFSQEKILIYEYLGCLLHRCDSINGDKK